MQNQGAGAPVALAWRPADWGPEKRKCQRCWGWWLGTVPAATEGAVPAAAGPLRWAVPSTWETLFWGSPWACAQMLVRYLDLYREGGTGSPGQ